MPIVRRGNSPATFGRASAQGVKNLSRRKRPRCKRDHKRHERSLPRTRETSNKNKKNGNCNPMQCQLPSAQATVLEQRHEGHQSSALPGKTSKTQKSQTRRHSRSEARIPKHQDMEGSLRGIDHWSCWRCSRQEHSRRKPVMDSSVLN